MLKLPLNHIEGRFVSEDKNRFRCTVEIEGVKETCYIASSCRLDNFVDLKGKLVLLKATESKNASTKYVVQAVKHKQSYILLNTSLANKAIENLLPSRRLASLGERACVKKEYTIEGYKSDFYIPCSKTIIEVKSIITTRTVAAFPTVYSERALNQLKSIEAFLESGYKAHYFILSLNPYVKEVEIIKDTEFYDALSRCISRGLIVDAFVCRLSDDGQVRVDKRIAWK